MKPHRPHRRDRRAVRTTGRTDNVTPLPTRARPVVAASGFEPATRPDDYLNRSRPDAVVHVSRGRDHDPVAIDLETVTTVLYLSDMEPAAMYATGPDGLAEYVLRTCEDPAARVPEMVDLAATLRASGHLRNSHWAQAAHHAPAVLAVFTRAVDQLPEEHR
ncbi:hypothetical protein AB0425_16600 [Actinosynnema sp. NPDC051121]